MQFIQVTKPNEDDPYGITVIMIICSDHNADEIMRLTRLEFEPEHTVMAPEPVGQIRISSI